MSSTASGQSPSHPPLPKQIRFVNNEGQPPAKRRRINAACRTCRKRKTRCDGKHPFCSTCTENGHECLGYADGGEIKRETKASDANRNADDNDDEYDEDMKSIESQLGNVHQELGNGQRRSQSQSLFDNTPKGQARMDTKREGITGFPRSYREARVFSDGHPSPMALLEHSVPHAESHRVPYFRYFGPTAIVPGFKQMVVSVREHRRSTGTGSSVSMSPGSGSYGGIGNSSQVAPEIQPSVEVPIYDQNDQLPVNRLIIHLVETFFTHLGCNYPFLQQTSFTQRVEERSVEAILVDAVCGLAARFSDHPLLTASHDSSYPKSEHGHVFAQRAKAAVVDTFPRPTVAATQACLLLAYEGFGANQDSALWMYLGCAIRMAVDLGLQKLDGVKYQGQKDPEHHRPSNDSNPSDSSTLVSAEEKKVIEQERIDTLWSVFMLDRVISSGTGRPVTLRDEDFELQFPGIKASTKSGWPDPFPALIQIIHLYGRVSDLLNNIRNVDDVTPKKIEGLVAMEKDLTQLYQKLDARLNFNAANFQHYCKAGEGTNFILVHFWFHTLIMLLHQPTLIHSFEGQILSLLPNSRELSMSSAKTVADILAFAELIDPRSFICNPFTSQPMYIAACAFLKESAAHTSSSPTSRDTTPPASEPKTTANKDKRAESTKSTENKQKHSLLASAANQNYQRCYKALQQLEVYWAGTRYILVALDQKAKGIWDPETYTEQEYEATKTKHNMIPNWRQKLALAGSPTPGPRFASLGHSPKMEPGSPPIDPSQAIGWSLTGTTNSPSSNLTFMYQNMSASNLSNPPVLAPGAGNMIYDPIRQNLPESTPTSTAKAAYPSRYQPYPPPMRQNSQPMPPPGPKYAPLYSDPASTSDAEMLLGLQNSPFPLTPGSHHSFDHGQNMVSPSATRHGPANNFDSSQTNANIFPSGSNGYTGFGGGVGEMMMQSQEIDMSTLGGEMMPWLEYLPQNMLDFFDNENVGGPMSGSAGG